MKHSEFDKKRTVALTLPILLGGVLLRAAVLAGTTKSVHPVVLGSVEWVGALGTAADVKGKPSWAKRFVKAVIGLDDREQAMLTPNGVAVDPQGRILVADTKGRV